MDRNRAASKISSFSVKMCMLSTFAQYGSLPQFNLVTVLSQFISTWQDWLLIVNSVFQTISYRKCRWCTFKGHLDRIEYPIFHKISSQRTLGLEITNLFFPQSGKKLNRKCLFHSNCCSDAKVLWHLDGKYYYINLIHSGKIHELNTLLFIYSFRVLVFTLPNSNKQDGPQPHCPASGSRPHSQSQKWVLSLWIASSFSPLVQGFNICWSWKCSLNSHHAMLAVL